MDISKRTDYALRMIAGLVENPEGIVSVRTVAKEGEIPYSFARSIQHDLALAGIVSNVRGANGGMRLAVDPRETTLLQLMDTLLQLMEAVQGPVVLSDCLNVDGNDTPCPNCDQCRFRPVWCSAEKLLRDLFSTVTLHQLVVEGLTPVYRGSFALAGRGETAATTDAGDAAATTDAGDAQHD